jgi:2-amino-4-hydroxy-6-hydroxymethyldihydropteridine diphosphokinase
MHDCLIAFGSNEGQSTKIFEQALAELSRASAVLVVAHSQPLSTVPVGGPKAQPSFLNAAIRIETTNSPIEMHRCLVEIESKLGRIRRERWGPRKIDLDLLLFDDFEIQSEKLTIPHPRMSFRRFVLEPAVEIAAEMIHVTSGRAVGQLLEHLDQREDLIIYVSQDLESDPLAEMGATIPRPWRFQAITPCEFHEYESRAKLVTYVRLTHALTDSLDRDRPVNLRPVSFPGPTLELPVDSDQAKIEILAAIEAMTPLDSGK